MMKTFIRDFPSRIGVFLLYGAILLGLYLTSLYSYILFHSLVELVSVIISASIFILVWNSQRRLDNTYLLFLGIAYLFVSELDLIHTLAYKGMGVFAGYDANLPTQLWIAARYLQSLSLLIAPLFLRRKLNLRVVMWWYIAVTAFLQAAIFAGFFPVCFVEGVGLTPFKIVSEYIISLILLASVLLLLHYRAFFDREALRWIVLSILFTIGGELAFTSYISVYGPANLLGHFFKLIAFYFIYRAIVEMGLERPHRLLFRDLQQSEAAQRTSLEKYRVLFDNLPLGITITDKFGHIVETNRASERMLGVSANEHFRRDLDGPEWRIIRPDGSPMPPSEYASVRAMQENRLVENVEMGMLKDQGEITWISVTAAPIPLEDYGVAVAYTDITRRKQAEAALRKSEYQYRTLVESVTEIISTVDRQGVFQFINTFGARSLGGTPEQIVGRNIREFFPLETAEFQMGFVEKVYQTRQPTSVESQSYIQGQPRWFHTSLDPLFLENGEIESVLCIASDLNERKIAETRLSASLAEKEVLLKEIHHRVKNNLAIMSSLLELQSRRSTSEQVREEFRISQQRILAMAQIHEQLYRSPSLAEINMADYVGALARGLLAMDILSDVDIQVDIQGVFLDIDQAVPCGLIINELLTNAVKYAFQLDDLPSMHQKEVRVTMRHEDGRFNMNISDNGVGLPDGLDVRKTRTLGFTLVQRLTGQLSGDIRVSSRPGGGTIFTISFPAADKRRSS